MVFIYSLTLKTVRTQSGGGMPPKERLFEFSMAQPFFPSGSAENFGFGTASIYILYFLYGAFNA